MTTTVLNCPKCRLPTGIVLLKTYSCSLPSFSQSDLGIHSAGSCFTPSPAALVCRLDLIESSWQLSGWRRNSRCFRQEWDVFKQQHEFTLAYGIFKNGGGNKKKKKIPTWILFYSFMLHNGMNSRNFLIEETMNYEMLPILKHWNILKILSLCCNAMVCLLNLVFIEIVLTEGHGIQAWRGWKKTT